MNLSFKTHFKNNKSTYFIDKIYRCVLLYKLCSWHEIKPYYDQLLHKFGYSLQFGDIRPKLHTIREGNRWKAGMKIHFCIGIRTNNYFRFLPVLKCQSTQKIQIKYINNYPVVKIDKRRIFENELTYLALNDGFESSEAFFKWFNKNFSGQIVHWTTLKY